jgi:hypothetical protein
LGAGIKFILRYFGRKNFGHRVEHLDPSGIPILTIIFFFKLRIFTKVTIDLGLVKKQKTIFVFKRPIWVVNPCKYGLNPST